MFNFGIWFLLLLITGIATIVMVFWDENDTHPVHLSYAFVLFSIAFIFCGVVIIGGESFEESYCSDLHDIHYGEVRNIESISVEDVEESSDNHDKESFNSGDEENNNKILKVLLTNKADRLQIKNYPFNPENSEENISDGYAVLSNSDKKVIEKVTATVIKTIDYHCPLIKNSTKEETITYYIVYYPANELKF